MKRFHLITIKSAKSNNTENTEIKNHKEDNNMKINNNEVKFTTNKVVLHNPHINNMWSYNDTIPKKYSTAIIVPEADIETLSLINEAVEQAKSIGRKLYGEHIEFTSPLREPGISNSLDPYYKFNYTMFPSTIIKPTVFNEDKQKIDLPDSKIEGHYARVSISFYPYSNKGKAGIGCTLWNVQLFPDMFDLSKYMSNPADDF